MAAPDETVRCVSLIMDEGKDSDCMKAVKSPERTKLVTVLNGTPEGSATAEAPAAASPAAAGCPEGAWVDPKGRACVVVPKGLKPGAETPNDDHSYIQFEDASGAVNFTLLFYPSGNYDSELKSMEHTLTALDNKLVEGPLDIAGGQGRYGKAQSDSIFEAESVVKNGDGFVECNTQWHKTDSGRDDWAAGCKSLAVPHK